MKLDIILRTHDSSNVHGYNAMDRGVTSSKPDIVRRCVKSLITSMEACKHKVFLQIVDDHSTIETLNYLKSFNDVESLQKTGNNASMERVFHLAKNSKADLIYLVEDDYLHEKDAIQDMLDTYPIFLNNVQKKYICLHPIDDMLNYTFHVVPTLIVAGKTRPWRMHRATTGTFLLSPQVIKKYWKIFNRIAKHYSEPGVTEDTTWNKIWKEEVPLFSPLVPLAFHLTCIKQGFYTDRINKLWKENK